MKAQKISKEPVIANSVQCSRCKRTCGEDGFSTEKWKRGLQGYKAECRRCVKDRNLIRLYGISIDIWETMMDQQKKSCYLCMNVFTTLKDIHVDHNHKTGAVRALLCLKCNVAVGMLREDGSLAIKFLRYIKDFEEWTVTENDIAELQTIFTDSLEISPTKKPPSTTSKATEDEDEKEEKEDEKN